jgi:hypothetical protein
MKDKFLNEQETLKYQVDKIHDLVIDACDICGGSYEDNLNGAASYFTLNKEHFKITIEKI